MLITLFIDVVSVLPAFMEQSAFLASTPRCACVRIRVCLCVCLSLTLSFSSPCISFFFCLFHLYPSNSSSISFISFPLVPHSYLISAVFYIRFHSVKAKVLITVFSSTSLFPYIMSGFSFFLFEILSHRHKHNHMWHTKPLTSHSQLGDV